MRCTKTNSRSNLMYLKKHAGEKTEILALCDEDILGKTLTENDLKLKISEQFFKGTKVQPAEAIKELKKSKNANLVGKEVIQLALKNGIIDSSSILTVQGIPYTLIFEL